MIKSAQARMLALLGVAAITCAMLVACGNSTTVNLHPTKIANAVGAPTISDVASAGSPASAGAASPASGELTGSIERGKSLVGVCMGCHSVDGSAGVGPTWQGLYGHEVTLEDGSTVTADAAYLTQSIREPSSQVVQGFPNAMPPFADLSDQDIADIIAYIESLVP